MKKGILFILFLSLSACGYSLRDSSHLPFSEISIDSITNKSTEPNIEDILHKQLAAEFIKQGIRVSNSAEYTLVGEIKTFQLRIVSEKNKFASEYEVIIKADFVIHGPDGFSSKYLSEQSPYIESFIAERDINPMISSKEVATGIALKSLSSRLVSEVIYR